MQAAAHSPEFAKKVGVPVGVAKEFNAADEEKRRRARLSALRKLSAPP